MLSGMESERTPAALVNDVERAQRGVAQRIEVPAWYDAALAGAVAVLVVGAALTNRRPAILGVLLVLASAAVIGWQMRRFREHNGVWVSGFRAGSTVVATVAAMIVVIAAVIGASAAADRGAWWLVVVLAAVAAGLYWMASKWWMAQYRQERGA